MTTPPPARAVQLLVERQPVRPHSPRPVARLSKIATLSSVTSLVSYLRPRRRLTAPPACRELDSGTRGWRSGHGIIGHYRNRVPSTAKWMVYSRPRGTCGREAITSSWPMPGRRGVLRVLLEFDERGIGSWRHIGESRLYVHAAWSPGRKSRPAPPTDEQPRKAPRRRGDQLRRAGPALPRRAVRVPLPRAGQPGDGGGRAAGDVPAGAPRRRGSSTRAEVPAPGSSRSPRTPRPTFSAGRPPRPPGRWTPRCTAARAPRAHPAWPR